MHADIYSSTRTEDKGIDKEPFKAIQRVCTDLVKGHLQVYKQMRFYIHQYAINNQHSCYMCSIQVVALLFTQATHTQRQILHYQRLSCKKVAVRLKLTITVNISFYVFGL